jgi:hypothetical protein
MKVRANHPNAEFEELDLAGSTYLLGRRRHRLRHAKPGIALSLALGRHNDRLPSVNLRDGDFGTAAPLGSQLSPVSFESTAEPGAPAGDSQECSK